MVRSADGKRAKRQAAGRGSGSPGDPPAPAAGRAGAGPASEPVQLSAAALAEIKQLIDQSNANVIRALEAKLESVERRLNMLEGECMEKDCKIQQLSKQLDQQVRANEELDSRLEELDMNGRLSSLILACDAFKAHPRSASVEQLVVTVLNQRVPGLSVTTADLQAAHKLQNDSKVFCKFTKRQVRDAVYESRFDMVRFREGNTSRDGRQLAPLYISESLTPRNRLLYDELLRAKRPESGGLIASVFSRRGVVWCRTERGGANLRVRDEADLRRILGGRRFPVQQRVSGRGALPRTSPAARRPPDSDSFDGRPPPRRAAADALPGPPGDSGAAGSRGTAAEPRETASVADSGATAPPGLPSAGGVAGSSSAPA
ncbi:hypothetical protein FJT64_010345 [Amphibalanus amphitrite]|uniref:Uncharacterized protein n=1 Tax=Amphibalanus amphitrite TaxID=1232801 RepID=A0A6A4VJX1_AMPAM|nr:hypothetical protein FJT64_010345 [Amphibalanus amphitrite]